MAILPALVLTPDLGPGTYDPPGTVAPVPTPITVSWPLTSDLDSEEAAPGKIVVASVNLPDGTSLIGQIQPTGSSVANFKIHDVKQFGATLMVMAENTSKAAARFTATFSYGPR